MRNYYIHYDQVPLLDLDNFDSAESLITALRVNPDVYSNVQDAATQTELTFSGTSVGYGFWFVPTTDKTVRFRESRLNSPAYQAGIRRGDELLTFNGSPIEQTSNEEILSALLDTITSVTMTIRTGEQASREVVVNYEPYQWRTAGHVTRFPASEIPGHLPIGYMQVSTFIDTTEAEITAAFQALRENGGIEELIIDLRYNPGGLNRVARHLASLIAGKAVVGQVFLNYEANDKYDDAEEIELFDTVPGALDLPRVFVLTTSMTSSASEAFINSLKPHIDVIVIGNLTDGKAYSSIINTYCGKAINAMQKIMSNSEGVNVFGGIQPDCRVYHSTILQG